MMGIRDHFLLHLKNSFKSLWFSANRPACQLQHHAAAFCRAKSREGQGQELIPVFTICSTTLPSTVRKRQFSLWCPDTKVTAKLLKYTKTIALEVKPSELFLLIQHIRSAPSLLIPLRAGQCPPNQTCLPWRRYSNRKASQHGGSDRTNTTKKVQPCRTENLSSRCKLHGLGMGWVSGILSGICLPLDKAAVAWKSSQQRLKETDLSLFFFFLYQLKKAQTQINFFPKRHDVDWLVVPTSTSYYPPCWKRIFF